MPQLRKRLFVTCRLLKQGASLRVHKARAAQVDSPSTPVAAPDATPIALSNSHPSADIAHPEAAATRFDQPLASWRNVMFACLMHHFRAAHT